MRRRTVLVALTLGAFVVAFSGNARPKREMVQLGYLTDRPPGLMPFDEAFLKGLRELGWVDGENIVIEYRWAEGNPERLIEFAANLVARNVDLIVAVGVPAAKAAKAATTSIPIVIMVDDPVAAGLVTNLARPGGNITGRTSFGPEIRRKRLELLKIAVPQLTRVGIVWNTQDLQNQTDFSLIEAAAGVLGLKVESFGGRFPDELESSFARATAAGVGAAVILSDSVTISYRQEIGALASKYQLPTMFSNKAFLKSGGLMSYGVNAAEMSRQTATFVDRVLKGTNPGDLPIEQPTMFELVINLKAARALGVDIPPSLLAHADELIE
jgi:putative tryptophan/tyrosine transport system substrate-binding protein